MLAPWKKIYDHLDNKSMTNLDQPIKKQRHYFVDKGPYTPSYGFSSSHVCTIKKVEHQRTWTARRSNQSILKEISPVFIGRTDAEAEAPILWKLDAKS